MLRSQTENVIDESRPHIPLSRTTERGGSVFPQILGSVFRKSSAAFPQNPGDPATPCALRLLYRAQRSVRATFFRQIVRTPPRTVRSWLIISQTIQERSGFRGARLAKFRRGQQLFELTLVENADVIA